MSGAEEVQVMAEVARMSASGAGTIECVKHVRERLGYRLKEALDLVRRLPPDLAAEARLLRAQAAGLIARAERIEAALAQPAAGGDGDGR